MAGMVKRLVSRTWVLAFALTLGMDAECSTGDWDIFLGQTARPGLAPRWTPDGEQIGFSLGQYRDADIYVASSVGTGISRISDFGSEEDGEADELEHSPDISPDGSRVVYATTRHPVDPDRSEETGIYYHNFEIETSKLDGSDRRRLTQHPLQDLTPAWSPDGSRIAFVRRGIGRERTSHGIYTMAADGSDLRAAFEFTPDLESSERPAYDFEGTNGLSWSPDGTRLAFPVYEPNQSALYTVGSDGSEPLRLYGEGRRRRAASGTRGKQQDIQGTPAWSPDVSRIAFLTHTEREGLSVYTIAPDGSNPRRVAHVPDGHSGKDPSVAWPPDGGRLLFSHGRADPDKLNYDPGWLTHIYVVDALGDDSSENSHSVGYGNNASWSPDGSRIAVVNYRRGSKDEFLYTVSPDGSDQRVLVTRQGEDGEELRATNETSKTAILTIENVRIAVAVVVLIALCLAIIIFQDRWTRFKWRQ